MADLFNKINVLIRAGLNDAASNLTGNSGDNAAQLPTPAEVTGDAAQPTPKPPSAAERAAARTDEKLDAAITLLQQRFLTITSEMNTLDKQIDAALVDNNDEVARQLTQRLQQQQRQAQQIADDMARYDIPLPAAPVEATIPVVVPNPPASPTPDAVVNRTTTPVNNPSSGFRVPVRTGDPEQKATKPPTAAAPQRKMNEVLTDRPAVPESDAKLAERRRRLSLPDDSDPKKSG